LAALFRIFITKRLFDTLIALISFPAHHSHLKQNERLQLMKSERTNIVFTAPAGMSFAIDGPGLHNFLQTNYARHYSHAPSSLKKTFRTKHITPIANSHTKAQRAWSIDMHLRLELMGYGSMYPVHKPVQHTYSRIACVDQPDLVTAFSAKRLLEELEPGVPRNQTRLLLTDVSSDRPEDVTFRMGVKPTQYLQGRGDRSVTLAADLVPGQGMAQQGNAGVEPTAKSTGNKLLLLACRLEQEKTCNLYN
jgi:hypothetical protein